MCITSCKQQSATHKRRMVNLWPNLTAYQSVSFFFLSPFARRFTFPFATFRCGPIKKKLLWQHVNLFVLWRMEEADFVSLQCILCVNYANVHGLPCCLRKFSAFWFLEILRKHSKYFGVKFDNRKKSYHFREPRQSFKVFEMLWVIFLAVTITSRELMVRTQYDLEFSVLLWSICKRPILFYYHF